MSSLVSPPSIKFSVLTSELGLSMISQSFRHLCSTISTPIPWSLDTLCWNERQHPLLLESFLKPLHLVWIPSDPSKSSLLLVITDLLILFSWMSAVANTTSYLELSSVSLLSADYSVRSMLPLTIPSFSMKHVNARLVLARLNLVLTTLYRKYLLKTYL